MIAVHCCLILSIYWGYIDNVRGTPSSWHLQLKTAHGPGHIWLRGRPGSSLEYPPSWTKPGNPP